MTFDKKLHEYVEFSSIFAPLKVWRNCNLKNQYISSIFAKYFKRRRWTRAKIDIYEITHPNSGLQVRNHDVKSSGMRSAFRSIMNIKEGLSLNVKAVHLEKKVYYIFRSKLATAVFLKLLFIYQRIGLMRFILKLVHQSDSSTSQLADMGILYWLQNFHNFWKTRLEIFKI